MRLLVSLSLCMAIGCLLAAGCIAETKKNTLNATPAPTFSAFSNQEINATSNGTTRLKGSLIVTISGYPVNLAVLLDNVTVGTVKPDIPLNLMVPEGAHTVKVCVGRVCEQENVTVRFGNQANVDFGERLRRDVEFPNPTARILEYFTNGDGVSVNLEFINPDTKDHTISADLSVGYTYIDDRSKIKIWDSTRISAQMFVRAGGRETSREYLNFAGGGSTYSYDSPEITAIQVK